MRSLAALTILLAAPAVTLACDRVVEITGVRPGAGAIRLAVYTDETSFRQRPAVALELAAAAATVRIDACAWPGGEVAIAAFQDLNGNQKMDANAFGMPTEPYVVSRSPGASRGFGAPSWAASKVTLAAGTLRLPLSE